MTGAWLRHLKGEREQRRFAEKPSLTLPSDFHGRNTAFFICSPHRSAHGKKPNVVLVKALLAFAAPNGAKIKATAYHPSPIRLSTEWVASQFFDGNGHGRHRLVQEKSNIPATSKKRLDKGCPPSTSDGLGIRDSPWKQHPQEGALPDRGLPRFPSLQRLGNRHCHSCKVRKSQEEKNTFWYSESTINFTYQEIHNEALDFLYISPSHFEESQNGNQSVIEDDEDSMPKAIRFYRPEEFNAMDAYLSDIHTVGGMEVEAILGQAKLPLVGVVSEDCLECPDHHSSMDNLCLV
nr:DNA (cytosine-5)-methyltransferase 1-like [Ipomoea batatas]